MEQLQKKEVECQKFIDAHRKSICEVEEKQKKQTTLEEMIKQLQSQMKQLNQEVETKSDLVRVFWYLHLHLRYNWHSVVLLNWFR